MENVTRPIPPNRSEGCFNCGAGKDEILQSKLNRGTSIALCAKCFVTPIANTQPFNTRNQ